MGMYTELVFSYEIPKDKIGYDEECILNNLFGENDIPNFVTLPKHPFFECSRWKLVGHCDSFYFTGDTTSSFRYDNIAKGWMLTTRFNIKNYGGEIERFLEWIWSVHKPEEKEFVGYKRYEEDDNPTIIYFDASGVIFNPVGNEPTDKE